MDFVGGVALDGKVPQNEGLEVFGNGTVRQRLAAGDRDLGAKLFNEVVELDAYASLLDETLLAVAREKASAFGRGRIGCRDPGALIHAGDRREEALVQALDHENRDVADLELGHLADGLTFVTHLAPSEGQGDDSLGVSEEQLVDRDEIVGDDQVAFLVEARRLLHDFADENDLGALDELRALHLHDFCGDRGREESCRQDQE